MEKKNNSNVLWIVIVVLVAIIACGIGWYLGGKQADKDQKKAEENVKETIKKDDEIFADVEKKMTYLLEVDQLGNRVLFAKDRTVDKFDEEDLLCSTLKEEFSDEKFDNKVECENSNGSETNKQLDENMDESEETDSMFDKMLLYSLYFLFIRLQINHFFHYPPNFCGTFLKLTKGKPTAT